jgi:hypothetical protein
MSYWHNQRDFEQQRPALVILQEDVMHGMAHKCSLFRGYSAGYPAKITAASLEDF